MNVIFGGHGFVGTALRALFDKEVIEYIAPTQEELDLTWFDSAHAVSQIVNDGDNLIMLAALTHEHGEAHILTEANVSMVKNVIEGIKGKNLSHCVYLSSDSVYGNIQEAPFWKTIDESIPPNPDTLYGHMHSIREQFFREYVPEIKLTILRPCTIYGLGDTHNAYGINQFIREAKDKNTITLFGKGEEFRSGIHVDDLAEIIHKAVTEKTHGTYNVNSGASLELKEVADFIKNEIGEITVLSKPRTKPIFHRHFNNSKLAKAFFPPRSLYEGIRNYLGAL